MFSQHNATPQNKRILCALAALLTLVVLASCGLPTSLGASGGNDELQQTGIALSVQGTSNAIREATLQAFETSAAAATPIPPTAEIDLQATLNAQMTAVAEQATAAAPTAPPPTQSAPPTEAPTVPEDIVLQKWDPSNFTPMTNCNDKDGLPCWVGQGVEIVLESSEPFLIDSNWERPHLVFSHMFSTKADAFIYINAGGNWNVLRSFPKGEGRWSEIALDLSKYKGEEVLLKFYVSGPTMKPGGSWWKPDMPADPSRWSILNIRLIPNYTN